MMKRFIFHHLLLVTVAILILFIPSAAPDIASDRAALLALRSAVGGRVLLWNLSSPTPCSWAGVSCSRGNATVVELHLPGMGLTGQLPLRTISNLTNLQTLSLRYNALSGPLPADLFTSLTSLRNLYLQHNFFSGQIPDSLFSLTSLVRVNLADNNFSGPISTSFNNLSRLGTLYLQNNHFSGPVPDLNLPGLVQFNVSNNNLTGQIPRGLSGKPISSFTGNSLCGDPLNFCGNEKRKKKLSGGAIAGIIIGSVIGFLLILLLLFCLCRVFARKGVKSKDKTAETEIPRDRAAAVAAESSGGNEGTRGGFAAAAMAAKEKEKSEENVVSGGKKGLVFFGKTGWSFDLEDLLRASAEVLGKGTYGTTYKAVLETGPAVAVKRLRDVNMGEKEFMERMEVVGRIEHENLVPLRAYYYNRDEKLLVYDYLPMGSLSALLHGNKGAGRTPLNWETRAAIALGAARGITYLHSQGSSISHGNIKSSNILLTKSYEARVTDFGLAQLAGPAATPNRIAGYRAPEVTDPHKVSHKADVYSFGVLLLELLTGKVPTHSLLNEEGVDLPRWVQSVVREEWTAEVFDLELLRYQNVEEDMVQLLQLAVDCTAQYPDKRPSMVEVTTKIEELCRWSLEESGGDIVAEEQTGSSLI
ncbi:Serine/threonine protein kinase [Handroanthus impetiginosus]|uniref:Serine/threonine protein kinase n=1 Tax=Handroanthus impetiginosus TaxID=429701 RepID=A0A2G9G4M3_9LAMI|nr:Serine/threonine protein kinase [Handroanthus impetiginosus]PIN11947.1 Serine/threonine protein kinase [Handroanthus impetiginosus]